MMADGITMEVFGMTSLMDNMNAYTLAVAAKVQHILDVGGDVGLQLMDELCPVDTGYLQSRNQKTLEWGSVTLSNDAPYAPPVELGHHTRSGSFVPAQPWIVPAFVTMEAFIKDELSRF